MGSCLSFPAEMRPRSLATAQAPLLHFRPVAPAPPSPTPTRRRGGRQHKNHSFTHKHSHQQRHVSRQPFPGERWASGVPATTTPPLGRLFAGGCPATAAQAHRGRCAHERALPPLCARRQGLGRGRTVGTRARLPLSLVSARHVTEAQVIATPVLFDLCLGLFIALSLTYLTQPHSSAPPCRSPSFPDSVPTRIPPFSPMVEKSRILGDS